MCLHFLASSWRSTVNHNQTDNCRGARKGQRRPFASREREGVRKSEVKKLEKDI